MCIYSHLSLDTIWSEMLWCSCWTVAPLLVIAAQGSSQSIFLIENHYAHNGHSFSGAKRLSSRSLVGSMEREETIHKGSYSIPFFKSLVVSLGNLRAVCDRLQ